MPSPPLGLYVHIPWCIRKCPYCDFNSHGADRQPLPESAYIQALIADLDHDLTQVRGRTVGSIFIGGGTPSLFSPEVIGELLEAIRQRLPLSPDAEITLEANPGTAEGARFSGFRQAGVTRLSIGIQSFQDRLLGNLGRIHDGAQAVAAVEMAKNAGFDNFNLDLMFGLPGQTAEEALADINRAVSLKPSHLSYYQLTLEPNTWFHKFPPELPPDESIWEMQTQCQARLAERGYVQYEVSAYARSGFRCRHNLNYWRFGDYLGIGAGAHGKITDPDTGTVSRTWKLKHPEPYVKTAGTSAVIGGREIVHRRQLPFEFLMNQLRLREGFSTTDFKRLTGLDEASLEPGLTRCLAENLLELRSGLVRCTDKGWNFLDNVLERFIDDPN
jgi:putative oxygen-independent coproporphyrinogen III oxidase